MLPQDVRSHKTARVSEPFCETEGSQVPARRQKNRDFPASARRRRSGSVPERRVNCVMVGDGAVGKSSLIVSYTTNGYPAEYVPTAFDNFTGNLQRDHYAQLLRTRELVLPNISRRVSRRFCIQIMFREQTVTAVL